MTAGGTGRNTHAWRLVQRYVQTCQHHTNHINDIQYFPLLTGRRQINSKLWTVYPLDQSNHGWPSFSALCDRFSVMILQLVRWGWKLRIICLLHGSGMEIEAVACLDISVANGPSRIISGWGSFFRRGRRLLCLRRIRGIAIAATSASTFASICRFVLLLRRETERSRQIRLRCMLSLSSSWTDLSSCG
jgi:hypothetical protein